jgi:hypothetical protein
MTLNWANLTWMLAMTVTACGFSFFILQFRNRRTAAHREQDLWRQLQALSGVLNALEVRIAAIEKYLSQRVPEPEIKGESSNDLEDGQPHPESGEISSETMAVISAASIAFAGSRARLKSARALGEPGVISPWTQQGRASVHASHNVRPRGWTGTVAHPERNPQVETPDNN